MDDPPVIGEGVGVDKDIIHIAYDLAIVDEISEDIIHHHLEHCRGVTQSKEHDSWLKQPSVSSEHSLPLIPFLDPHVVKSPSEVKYSEELGVMEYIQQQVEVSPASLCSLQAPRALRVLRDS